jgi:hypothetical protein
MKRRAVEGSHRLAFLQRSAVVPVAVPKSTVATSSGVRFLRQVIGFEAILWGCIPFGAYPNIDCTLFFILCIIPSIELSPGS